MRNTDGRLPKERAVPSVPAMRKIMEMTGFVMMVLGAAGVAHSFFEWFKLMNLVHQIGFLAGYELFASIVLLVLGFLVAASGARFGS